MPDTFSERRRMPAETAPHEQTWMAWPSGGYTFGESPADADEARRAWAEAANAVHEFEPLRMLVPAQELRHARRLLVHHQRSTDHWDAAVMRESVAALASARDASGKPLDLVPLPAPTVLRDREDRVDYSYVNHHVVNDAVIMCAFGDPGDDKAEILADSYPGREIVRVDARPLFAGGGGVHCITQQPPALPTDLSDASRLQVLPSQGGPQ